MVGHIQKRRVRADLDYFLTRGRYIKSTVTCCFYFTQYSADE